MKTTKTEAIEWLKKSIRTREIETLTNGGHVTDVRRAMRKVRKLAALAGESIDATIAEVVR